MNEKGSIGYTALVAAIIGYGGLWPVTKIALEFFPPFWFAALRILGGAIALFFVLQITGKLRLPTRHDLPLVLSVGFFMMALFTLLMHLGLIYVEAGRAALLGYTTPVWVLPAAYCFLGERPSRRRLLGLVVAITGLIVLFNPSTMDWSDRNVVVGNILLLMCGLSWSVSIVHIRKHQPQRTPLQLAPFQLSFAALILIIAACMFDPFPTLTLSTAEVSVLAYGSIMGTAVAMLSVTVCFKFLPTLVSTVGLLGVPVFAMLLSVTFLDEKLTAGLITGMVLIIGGIGLVSVPSRKPR